MKSKFDCRILALDTYCFIFLHFIWFQKMSAAIVCFVY